MSLELQLTHIREILEYLAAKDVRVKLVQLAMADVGLEQSFTNLQRDMIKGFCGESFLETILLNNPEFHLDASKNYLFKRSAEIFYSKALGKTIERMKSSAGLGSL